MLTPTSEGPTHISAHSRSGDPDTRLDPNLVALAVAHNIGTLATIKVDGRPHLSPVNFTLNPVTALARFAASADHVVVHNMRRDPRASIFVASRDGWTYAALEGTVELTPMAQTPDDDTVAKLVELFRAIRGTDHPDWDDYRATMVANRQLVARLHVESAYGVPGPGFAISA